MLIVPQLLRSILQIQLTGLTASLKQQIFLVRLSLTSTRFSANHHTKFLSAPQKLAAPDSLLKPTMATQGSSDISTYEVIPTTITISESVNKAKLPCYLLKSHTRNLSFFGRKDVLLRLGKVLLPDATTNPVDNLGSNYGPRIFAICGIGGVGKTQLAVEFAFGRMDCYDAIFWLHADDATKLAKDFSDISVSLGLEKVAGDQAVSKDLVLDWLSRPQGRRSLVQGAAPDPRWLLIFDNADDLDVLVDYLPVSGNGSVLVTSRDPLAKTQTRFRTTDGIDLDPFSKVDGGTLLRTLTGYNRSTSDIELSQEISEKLSGLPLGIVQIAGTIARRDLSLQEFLELFESDSDRLDFYRSVDARIVAEGGQRKSIFSVWALEDLGPQASSLLDLLSGMDPDRMQEGLFTTYNNAAANKTLSQFEGYPKTPLAFVNGRTELARSSLIKRNVDLKELSMHRLIQDAVRTRMHQDRLHKVFQSSVDLISASWSFGTFDHSTKRHPLCELVFPHIRSLQLWYKGSDRLKKSKVIIQQFPQLLVDAAW